MRIAALSVLAVASVTSAVSAQTIYQPLRVQYGGQNPYYYAGCSPLVHAAAAYPSLPRAAYGRHNGFAFTSSRRTVVERGPRVFADFRGPHGNPLTDLTIADVINAARAQMPRHFTKADAYDAAEHLDEAAAPVATADVPSRPGSIVIIVHRRPVAARPTTQPTQPTK